MFSTRTGWPRDETLLARALTARQAAGLPVLDLTASNPTHCGLTYSAEQLLAPLSNPDALAYHPSPFGHLSAREAVSRYYADHGAQITPEHICLTTGTSEAYSFLFRLLCDPGDEVLITQPSYPLFDYLADLDNVRLRPVPLLYDHGWQLEPGALQAGVTARTRAIVLVHPNNPTGHYTSPHDRAQIEAIAARHGVALIVDEVFLDYALSPDIAPRSFTQGCHTALTFTLSGLSKVAALPQMKGAWIVTTGPQSLVAEALARLELIADAFLSMNAPIQYALPTWLTNRATVSAQITQRTRANLAALDQLLAQTPLVSRLQTEAGWYAILRVPALQSDDDLALDLFTRRGVLVHPGHYYGFPGDGWLVVSLLPQPETFAQGVQSILRYCEARAETLL